MSDRKELIQLEELVRKAQSLIHPIGYEDTLKDLMTKPATDVFKGDYTKCVIPWKIGAQQIDLPICNRYGMVDPKIIALSRKMVMKMANSNVYNGDAVNIIIGKLDRIAKRFIGSIPKPPSTSAKNGAMTRYTNRIINNLKGHLS